MSILPWLQVWDSFLSTVGGGHSLTKDTFREDFRKLVQEGSIKEKLTAPLMHYFDAVDTNNDGQISQDEYKVFFGCIGCDQNEAPSAFQAIDTNHDNNLSKDEFLTAGYEFFTSEDTASPSKLFWGSLKQWDCNLGDLGDGTNEDPKMSHSHVFPNYRPRTANPYFRAPVTVFWHLTRGLHRQSMPDTRSGL